MDWSLDGKIHQIETRRTGHENEITTETINPLIKKGGKEKNNLRNRT